MLWNETLVLYLSIACSRLFWYREGNFTSNLSFLVKTLVRKAKAPLSSPGTVLPVMKGGNGALGQPASLLVLQGGPWWTTMCPWGH